MKSWRAAAVNVFLLIVVMAIGWLGFNAWLYHTRQIDWRSPVTVLADEWSKYEDVMLFIAPQNYVRGEVHPMFRDALPDGITMPLGSVPDIRAIYCQEDEGWFIGRTDRYGFFNPNEAWNRPIELLMIGDSFANGACTPANSRHYLAEHANTVTLGSGGNGPLTELATLREFLAVNRAGHIVWYIFDNDFSDLEAELAYPPLRAYYDDAAYSQNYFEQDLSGWPERILETVPAYLEANRANISASRRNVHSMAYDIASGRYLKGLLYGLKQRWTTDPATPTKPARPFDSQVHEAFWTILQQAVTLSKEAGVPLTFVFLPSKPSCQTGTRPADIAALLERVRQAGFNHLDARSIVAKDSCDRLFATKRGAHLTRYGYKQLADLIWEHVN